MPFKTCKIETESVPLQFSIEPGSAEGTVPVLTWVRDARVARSVLAERIAPHPTGMDQMPLDAENRVRNGTVNGTVSVTTWPTRG